MKAIRELFVSASKAAEIEQEQIAASEVRAADLERELRRAKSEGYAEAVNDLIQGIKDANSFALVSVAPTVMRIQQKARELEDAR